MPSASSRLATVDFPDPAGPHIKTTLIITPTIAPPALATIIYGRREGQTGHSEAAAPRHVSMATREVVGDGGIVGDIDRPQEYGGDEAGSIPPCRAVEEDRSIIGVSDRVQYKRESVWKRLEVREIVEGRAPPAILFILLPEVRLIAAVKIYVDALDRRRDLSRRLIWSTKVDHGAYSVGVNCLPPLRVDSFQPLRANKHARGCHGSICAL